jgi:hypothetical protein
MTPASHPVRVGPPSGYDLDKLRYHINLRDFGSSLQKAANAIFPGGQLSRYSKVDVILLSWEEEDPNLPVSLEIQELKAILEELYGYNVEEWLIPGEDCHNRLQSRILEILGDSDRRISRSRIILAMESWPIMDSLLGLGESSFHVFKLIDRTIILNVTDLHLKSRATAAMTAAQQ